MQTKCIATVLLVLSIRSGILADQIPIDKNGGTATSAALTATSKTPSKKANCYRGDLVCEKDKLGYEAISSLHAQMDDDHNGDIDLEESEEFLREELQYSKSHLSDHRSKKFHMNDTHITVDDLWIIWKRSEVHNWTVDKTAEWLMHDVELPQYVETFKINAVDGSTLPRLAVNNFHFVSNILGIKNLVHKQKLALKATDVVLFGPPKSRHNYFKDAILITAIAVAAGGCWFAYRQNKQLELNMAKAMKDMESLSKSEEALKALQEKLETEENEKRQHIEHKEQLEAKIKREISEAKLEAQQLKLTKEQTEHELNKMKQIQFELEKTREALRHAKKELEVRNSFTPTLELQKWLQITYELELKAYNEKKTQAEQQLFNAKESIERMRKKKQALFGSLRMAHSGCIDETDQVIINAKRALEEVKHDLSERQYRWQQVENMCSFSVLSNPGLRSLIHSTGHTDLYRFCHGGELLDSSPDLDDLDDVSPTYGAVLTARRYSKDSLNRISPRSSFSVVISALNRVDSKHYVRSTGPASTRSPLLPLHNSVNGAEDTHHAVRQSSAESSVINEDSSSSSKHDQPTTAGSLISDSTPESPQPTFSLYNDEAGYSSSGSNDVTNSIPVTMRPRLERHRAVHYISDNTSTMSDPLAAVSARSLAIRPRSCTNESLARVRSSISHASSSPVSSKKSESVHQKFKSSATLDCIASLDAASSKPKSTTPQPSPTKDTLGLDSITDSDRSLSRESLNENKQKKKKKRMQLFKVFKPIKQVAT